MKDVGIVKNPLTIIAIFAGLVEISATTVLPFISETLQGKFIWFLMVFPSMLVVLFFIILFFKPAALYAPSDFTDQESFMRIHEKNKSTVSDNNVVGDSGMIIISGRKA
ncbi:hypothetical protein ACMGEE_01450 [Erwinia sp. DT-104]|uniref:hypothetical protein n=1 Tax=Erwiniaceae TaxID=1903409 RepID=UPI00320A6E69